MVVIPSTIQVCAWCSTILTGQPRFKTPLLFIVGFIVFFVTRRPHGGHVRAIPFDQQMTDTYFVVAHFHYIIFGAAVFPIFGGMYYWFPKVTGRMYFERPGADLVLADLPRHEPDVLPDAHRRLARHAAPRLHVPGGLGLGRRTTSPRRSAASSRSPASSSALGNLVVSYSPRRTCGPRPVARADARVERFRLRRPSSTSR